MNCCLSPLMGYRYNKRRDTRRIHYRDKNKIYGEGICQHLPTGNFVENEVTGRNIDKLSTKQIIPLLTL